MPCISGSLLGRDHLKLCTSGGFSGILLGILGLLDSRLWPILWSFHMLILNSPLLVFLSNMLCFCSFAGSGDAWAKPTSLTLLHYHILSFHHFQHLPSLTSPSRHSHQLPPGRPPLNPHPLLTPLLFFSFSFLFFADAFWTAGCLIGWNYSLLNNSSGFCLSLLDCWRYVVTYDDKILLLDYWIFSALLHLFSPSVERDCSLIAGYLGWIFNHFPH